MCKMDQVDKWQKPKADHEQQSHDNRVDASDDCHHVSEEEKEESLLLVSREFSSVSDILVSHNTQMNNVPFGVLPSS